ncbi:MAG: M50 family metallopeptidase [Fidelibacterota bacterium]
MTIDSIEIVENSIRNWCEKSEVKDKILFRYIFAINEVMEAVIKLAEILRIEDNINIKIEPYQKHITTHLTFSRKIPLDPDFDHTDDFLEEYPELKVAPDIFWHQVVKKWVDKASWSKSSLKTITISLTQYARAQDNQAGELYFLNMKPRPVKGLRIEYIKDDVVVARGKAQESAVKLTGKSIFVLNEINGKTSVREIYYNYVNKYGFTNPKLIGNIIEDLEQRKLIEISSKRLDDAEESNLRQVLGRLLKFRYSIPNADPFIGKTNKKIGWLWSFSAYMVYIGFLIVSIMMFSQYIPQIKNLVNNYFASNSVLNAKMIAGYYLGISIFIIIHEFSHAITCKRFGGRVQEFGIMFYYANIAFFVDTTDSWMFKNKWKRMMVSFAGPFSTILLASIAGWFWIYYLHIGNHTISPVFGTVFIVGLIHAFINLLPFLQLDGYFILSDFLERPNLHQKSIEALVSIIKKNNKFSVKDTVFYLIYSVLAITMIGVLLLMLVKFLMILFVHHPGLFRWVITGLVITLFFEKSIKAGLTWYKNKFMSPIDLKINN